MVLMLEVLLLTVAAAVVVVAVVVVVVVMSVGNWRSLMLGLQQQDRRGRLLVVDDDLSSARLDHGPELGFLEAAEVPGLSIPKVLLAMMPTRPVSVMVVSAVVMVTSFSSSSSVVMSLQLSLLLLFHVHLLMLR